RVGALENGATGVPARRLWEHRITRDLSGRKKAKKEGDFSSRGKHEAQTVRHPDRVDVAGSATHRFTLRAGLGPVPGAHGHVLRREWAAEWLDAARDLSLFRTRPHRVRVDHLHHHRGDPPETESRT